MAVIENTILTTLSFFDTMGLPITPLEIYRNSIYPPCQSNLPSFGRSPLLWEEPLLWKEGAGGGFQGWCSRGGSSGGGSYNFSDFLNILESSEVIKEKTIKNNGMFCLKDNRRDAKFCVSTYAGRYNHRQLNYRMAIKKWIILRRRAQVFEAVPFCQAAFASGSITRNNTSENSDIDLLVIGEHGRLWTVRALMTLAAKLLGRHRSGNKVKDMFCLNHFISDKDLEIKHKSIYTAELYSKLVPIFSRNDFDGENVLEKFREKNQWIKNYIPAWYDPAPETLRKFSKSCIFKSARKFLEFILGGRFGDFVEKIARLAQEPRVKKDAGKPDGRVIFTDEEIELHPNSPEKRIVEGLNLRLENLGLEGEWGDSGLTPNYELRITNYE